MKPFFFLAAAFLLLPISVLAFDCGLVEDGDACRRILEMDVNQSEKDSLLSSLLYPYSSSANHDLIEEYNLDIRIKEAPIGTPFYGTNHIRDAWMSFLAVFPSVYYGDELLVPGNVKALAGYGYRISLPSTYKANEDRKRRGDVCKIEYFVADKEEVVSYYLNGEMFGSGKLSELKVGESGELKAELEIKVRIGINTYKWETYSLGSWQFYRCSHTQISYTEERITIPESKNITLYDKPPIPKATIIQSTASDYGNYSCTDCSSFDLKFANSSLSGQIVHYDVVFEKQPYAFACLRARDIAQIKQSNLILSGNRFFVKDSSDCSISAHSHFNTITRDCEYQEEPPMNTEESRKSKSRLGLVLHLAICIFIVYVIGKLIGSNLKKLTPFLLILFLIIPFVSAAETECGITNLASCIPEKIYEYFLYVINAPLLPMLLAVKSLLTAEPSISIFSHLWSVIRYIISFFYIFFFIYSGFIFISSGGDPIKRARAKDMLKDCVLMIILIQSSFLIYGMAVHLNAILSDSLIGMIDPHFFMLTADNLANIGLEFMFGMVYALTLFWTMLMLALRYIIVCLGVIFFPIAIFCFYIPPLRGYGRFMLHCLGIFIFISFFDLLIILACSMLLQADVFENFKVLVMISCFAIVNYTLYLAVKFALKRSASGSLKDDLNQAVKYIAMVV